MTNSFDWDKARQEILSRLDLLAEARSLGIDFCTLKPNSGGWMGCYAIGRKDGNPSAAICIDGPPESLGLYKDSAAGGKSCSFFEMAAATGAFVDWKAARNHYAEQTGVELPEKSSFDDQVVWLPWNRNTARGWCKHYKQGVQLEMLESTGAKLCRWPARAPVGNVCIAIPGFREADGEPVNWALYRTDGRDFPEYRGKDGKVSLSARKCHTLRGGNEAWISAGGPAHWASAVRIWKCEGPTDALALQSILPAGEVAVANMYGAGVDPARLPLGIFSGRDAVVVGDADRAGVAGAERFAQAIGAAGGKASIAKLPFDVVEKHGRDLRDWVNAGATTEDAIALAAAAEPVIVTPGDSSADLSVENYTVDFEGERMVRKPVPLPEIARKIQDSRGNWPKSISGALFVEGRPTGQVPDLGAIHHLKNNADLFAWLRQGGAEVRWAKECSRATPATKEELYSFLCRHAREHFSGLSYFPHHPKISGLYYVPCNLPPSDGVALTEFLNALNPETSTDRDLLLAAMITPGWGGPPGQRPAFLVTSEHGRGVGKTKTAEAIAEIWGGAISTNMTKKSAEEFRSRLLDDTGLASRCAIIDNVKGVMSSAEIESLITAKVIDGKRMYHGDYRRSNLLTWFITANSPALSKDIADRSVLIKIGKKRTNDFGGWVDSFLQKNRLKLLADIFAIICGPDRCVIEQSNLDRWNAWQRAILHKFPMGNELAEYIKGARPSVDVDSDEAESAHEAIVALVSRIKQNGQFVPIETWTCSISIPVSKLYEKLREAWGEATLSDKATRSRLNEMIGNGPLARAKWNACRTYGRSLVYMPPNATHCNNPIYPWSQKWMQDKLAVYEIAEGGDRSF